MAKCEYCGSVITSDMKVCESCGAPIPENAFASENSCSQTVTSAGDADYRLILVSRGSCERSQAEDLLEDLLSYSEEESQAILDSLPAEAAKNLTRKQASYLAQAMTEYGMNVSVCNGDEYVDLSAQEDGSVFDSSGNYIRRFAEILAMLTAANRVSRPARWERPIDQGHIFMPNSSSLRPPVHKKRKRSLLERLFGSSKPQHEDPKPAPLMDRNPDPAQHRKSNYSRRPEMGGSGEMFNKTSPMNRNAGPGGKMMDGRGQSRNGSPSMRQGGGPGGARPDGGRGPSRGHGPR